LGWDSDLINHQHEGIAMTEMTTIPEYYNKIRAAIVELLKSTKSATARNVNSIMTAAYWDIGRRIVKFEQAGKRRAEYGEQLIEQLSEDLTRQFGRGFGRIRLIPICAEKGAAEAHYALDNLPNKVLTAEYQTVLPDERLMAEELGRSRQELEKRPGLRKSSSNS
jgi:hypothetical protein